MEFRNVFVTGSGGLVGSPFVRALVTKGHQVKEYDAKEGYDTLDFGMLLDEMKGCDTVVHLAAIPFPHPNKSWPEFWSQNCLSVQNVARAARYNNIRRFIFTSSMAYYGVEDKMPVTPPFPEYKRHMTQYLVPDAVEGVTEPAISYIQSKVIAENILAVYGYLKMFQVVILRLSPVRGDKYLGSNVFNENVTPALVHLVETDREMWYEVFNFSNPGNEDVAPVTKWDTFWGDGWEWPYS